VVIVAPPLSVGAVNATVAEVGDTPAAIPIVGADGTAAITAVVFVVLAEIMFPKFDAVTTHRMADPTYVWSIT
jgi:hypothetical protein